MDRKKIEPNPEPDPTQSSVIGVKKEALKGLPNEESSRRLRFEDIHGRVFHGDWLPYGSDQILLSRMLKGILPVADVVFSKGSDGEGRYYSYQVPLKDVPKDPKNRFEDRAFVDQFLLQVIFHDFDHEVPIRYSGKGGNAVANDGENYYLFDFDKFRYFWDNVANREELLLTKVNAMNEGKRKFLKQRISQLVGRIEGPSGLEFLQAIISSLQKMGTPLPSVIDSIPGENKLQVFQEAVLSRIHDVEELIL